MLTNLALICTFLIYHHLITSLFQNAGNNNHSSCENYILLYVSHILFSDHPGLLINSLHTIICASDSVIHKDGSTFSIKQITSCCRYIILYVNLSAVSTLS